MITDFLMRDHSLRIRLALGFLVLAAAFGFVLLLQPYLENHSLFVFLGAVILCSLLCGLPISLGVSVLAALLHNYFFQYPLYSFRVNADRDLWEILVFVFLAVFLSAVGASLRKAYAEAQTAIRAREEILATVSHDLKNPLFAIQANAELIARGRAPADQRSARLIQESAGQMSRLIADLLDFEKIRMGSLAVEPGWKEIPELLRAADHIMRPIAEQARVRLLVKETESRGEVWADRPRVLQVICNLVGNAVKFTPAGGLVEVSCSFQGHGDRVRFMVKDQGRGIEPAQLPLIFNRYWQAQETSGKGTGLGLAISSGIVKAHGGQIGVRSELGRGSLFYFDLPAREAHPALASA